VYKGYTEWNNLVCKVPKGGGTVEILMNNIKTATEITVDSDYVYFIDERYNSPGSGIVWRMGKNGENPTELVSGLVYPFGIAQDFDYIYFTEGQVHVSTGYVKKVSKSGGPVITLDTTTSPQGLVVDSDYVYFTSDRYTASKIWRVNKDGTNKQLLAEGLQTNVDNLAIDNDYVYFAEYVPYQDHASRIGRVPKVGGDVEILASNQWNAWDVDVDSDYVYFSEHSAGKIKRVLKTGGSLETMAEHPSAGPESVIIEADYLYYSTWDGVYRMCIHCELTITSSPVTGITFTINGTPEATPYTDWLLEGSYSLEMPEIHGGYMWSHWLEDGDTNRIKIITLPGTTWTGVYVLAPPVGGVWVPINKLELFAPWIGLASLMIVSVASVVYVKHRKKEQN